MSEEKYYTGEFIKWDEYEENPNVAFDKFLNDVFTYPKKLSELEKLYYKKQSFWTFILPMKIYREDIKKINIKKEWEEFMGMTIEEYQEKVQTLLKESQ